MSRYIKLDTAIEHTNQLYHGDEVEAWLESLPTIDITLCCECECSDISEETGISRCCKFDFFNDLKGGCSYGERIEE